MKESNISYLKKYIKNIDKKLRSDSFVNNAPLSVLRRELKKKKQAEERLKQLRD